MLERTLAQQPLPDLRLVVVTGVVALVVVLRAWRTVRLGLTVVHEAGHALVAVLVGRRLSGIRLHRDTSGVTVSRGRPTGVGVVVMYAAGYLAPGVLGLAAALLLAAGRPLALLWLLVVVLVSVLVWIRNGFGLVVVVALAAALGVMGWYADDRVVTGVAYLLAWVLLLASPRPLLELLAGGRRRRRGSDPDHLARLTRLPAVLWILLLLAANLAGLAYGALTLVPDLRLR